ncbi:MAG: alpha/beta hydrolase [Gammaproteobacteria bacterium]|nr:MAG: alpha/beta hydrolase [Gammaproteobacteria bacterium]
MKEVLGILAALALAYGGLCLFAYLFQDRLLYLPTREVFATPGDIGLAFEPVILRTRDGLKLHGWFIPRAHPRATLLFCHGNAGNLAHRLESLRIFHDLGLSVLIFDYRGYGRSEGRPSEEGTYWDAEAAWHHLTRGRGIAPGDIIVFGRSLGGAIAAHLAARRAPKALILESTFTSLPELAAELYPFLPAKWLTRFRYDTRGALKDLRSPLLIIHSREDEIIPFHHALSLYRTAPPPKALLAIHGSHNGGFRESLPLYTQGLEGFLAFLEGQSLPGDLYYRHNG